MAEPTQEEVRQFQAAAVEFSKAHPDFPEKLAQAQKRASDGGVDLPMAATHEIIRLCSPETAYTIFTDDKEQAALHVAKGEYVDENRVVDRVRRVHSRLRRNDTFKTVSEPADPVRTYLDKRRADIRSGKRRR